MSLGDRGRPAASPSIDSVTDLTAQDVANYVPGKGKVKVLRDTHHMLARLIAIGLQTGEVSARTGYSSTRISVLKGDPAFQQLIAEYRKVVNDEFAENVDEYFGLITKNRVTAARLIADKLEDAEPADVTFSQLVAIHADAADRTGYPKRSVAVNVNVDFAARLDQAIKRSAQAQPKLIEEGGRKEPVGTSHHPHAGSTIIDLQPTLRRRA